ncbi:type II toxin-antitoxin system VapC family toxin [bacterium]|nr:type II toxin-antitoxin system VapC family toxin [bacterium]
MIGVDTNILVRFVTKDDVKQTKLAEHLLQTICTSDNPGYVNSAVLVEVLWVLKRFYGASKENLIRLVEQLLIINQLELANRDAVEQALQLYRDSKADFADCLILSLNLKAGCEVSFTFDKAASKLPAFERLS